VKLFENLMAEAGADVADVPPRIVFAYPSTRAPKKGRVRLGA
jgi:hypothetical protein